MITRIKIDGFKSLLNTELYFGPFTCIAGANAIGKSNFFDAILFLSKLADNTILESAKSIRSEDKKHSNIRDIFYKSGEQYYNNISFEIDMLISGNAEDDLGQTAKASITSLKYTLILKLNEDEEKNQPIEIVKEELKPITINQTKKSIFFEKSKEWEKTVVWGRRASIPFISTDGNKIKLHSDAQDKRGGRTTESLIKTMPRTLLSSVTAESPTAFLARQEMRNWILLQFEPSALRQPNNIYEVKNAELTENGYNLPATLYRLNIESNDNNDVYQRITNQVKELVINVKEIDVDKDDKRDLLTLQVKFKDGLTLPAQSLSDGTLRYIGLAVINEDNKNNGLICMEEPENGINPSKIESIVELLENIATDTSIEINENNSLRQVIINTHSPLVVSTVPQDSLYLASEIEMYSDFFQKKIKYTSFSAIENTWKTINCNSTKTTRGEIETYLGVLEKHDINEYKESYLKLIADTNKKKKTVKEYYNQLQTSLF